MPVVDWSSYLGGNSLDGAYAIAMHSDGNAWMAGSTQSSDLASGGFDTSYNGNGDAFVAKINANGTLAWSSLTPGTWKPGTVSRPAVFAEVRDTSPALSADT